MGMDQNDVPTNSAVSDSGATSPSNVGGGNVMVEVANRISGAKNILVALSSDPSVDEMAAAIGLTLYLDRLGKRATAIYSGATPNALEFLEPDKTFESTADTLQDFVIALNKDKADHLRYKLDGEYVKIYITPYKARIDSSDLEFSYGDYNVDLVIALDVTDGADLDSALREHGRIMHDAAVINITTSNPGKFGEVEWSDKGASSVSEMIAKLLYSASSGTEMEKDDATAFLTGIVAATNRFSNAKTTPDTMQIASRLMESGANQQLVSKNITPDVENELYKTGDKSQDVVKEDPTKLKIAHDMADAAQVSAGGDSVKNIDNVAAESVIDATENVGAGIDKPTVDNAGNNIDSDADLMKDLKEAAANLTQAGNEVVPEATEQPMKIKSGETTTAAVESELAVDFGGNNKVSTAGVNKPLSGNGSAPVSSMLPPVMPNGGGMSVDTGRSSSSEEGQVSTANQSDDVLSSDIRKTIQPPVKEAPAAAIPSMPSADGMATGFDGSLTNSAAAGVNPALVAAPKVASAPEINGVPEMNFMPLPGQEILPPPPTPPLDVNNTVGTETLTMPPSGAGSSQNVAGNVPTMTTSLVSGSTETSGAVAQPMPLGPQPAMQDQVYTPQAADPSAFKIPGL